MTNNFEQEEIIAVEAAKKAGEKIVREYQKEEKRYLSKHENPSTQLDKDIDALLYKSIINEYPEDNWLSEELGFIENKGQRMWITDPIDGTRQFLQKIEEFAISIALLVERELVLSVVYNPITDELFTAVKGQGAKKNGMAVKVSSTVQFLGETRVYGSISELGSGRYESLEEKVQLIRSMGSIAYRLAKVASGEAEVAIALGERSVWDIAGGVLLITEAGGICIDRFGEKVDVSSYKRKVKGILAGNVIVALQICEFLKKD